MSILRRLADAIALNLVAANAYHLLVCACRWWETRGARGA